MTTAMPGRSATQVAPGVRGAVLAVALVAVGAVVVAATTGGSADALGALIGAGMVLVFFLFGAVTVNVVAARMPSASLLVALLTYTLEVVALALVFIGLTRSGATDSAIDRDWLGLTAIAGTLAWTAAQTIGAVRVRRPLYDVELPEPAAHGVSATEVGGGDPDS
jgi:ATP synthase protein I